jgi:integrase
MTDNTDTKTTRVRLTQSRIDALEPPRDGEVTVHDTEVRGLALRLRAGGSRVWSLRYRIGGRNGQERRLTLGDANVVSLKAARDAARMAWGERARGHDVQAVRKEAARRERARLGISVDRYIGHLESRNAASVRIIASLLRRELVTALGAATDLATLDRARLAARIEAVAASGRVGLSREFRTRVSVFLNWAASEGLIGHNPLLGMRLPRATRAEGVAQHGRALNEDEVRAFWQAADATGEPIYACYLRTLLLSGCRRTELALARWSWMQTEADTGRTVLVLPREITKNGRVHTVPLPEPVLALLVALPRRAGTDLIFPAWRGDDTPMSGWSKRWAKVTTRLRQRGVTGRVTLHDLRRTARSWWTELGVPEAVAELMLNHRPRSRLVALYDRAERMDERHAAAELWASHVFAVVARDSGQGAHAPVEPDDTIKTHTRQSTAVSYRTAARNPGGGYVAGGVAAPRSGPRT